MGNSASKSETKVFTPSTPVDFSASFLSQLEGLTQVGINSLISVGEEHRKYEHHSRILCCF